jgi:hypothetical protein
MSGKAKLENDQESLQLERFLQKKKQENEVLQKLLKALQEEEKKGLHRK